MRVGTIESCPLGPGAPSVMRMALRTKLKGPWRIFLRFSPATLETAPSDQMAPVMRDEAEAAATRAIEDFLTGPSEARAPQSLSSESTKHPPAG